MDITNEYRKQVVLSIMNTNICHRRVVEKRLQSTGVYRSQHQLLMHISKHPNRSQIEIAEGMGITPATVAVTIKKLVKAGYIKKQMDDKDNRFNKIELTEKAVAVVNESIHIFDTINEAMLKEFTEEEMETMMNYMNRIQSNLNAMEG